MHKANRIVGNNKRGMWTLASGPTRPRNHPLRIIKILSGVLLAATGIAAPEGSLAETRAVEEERTEISAQETEQHMLAASAANILAGNPASADKYTPKNESSSVVIINNDSVILSENDGSKWNKFSSLTVGQNTSGFLVIDGRDISTSTGSIGYNSTGSITLTNAAKWFLNNNNLYVGWNNGDGTLIVENGSQITEIKELRIGEFYEKANGLTVIDGQGSSISTAWAVVGDQGKGILKIINGGKLTSSTWMNLGYVGVTPSSSRKGDGEVLVMGDGSELNVAKGLYLGGFILDPNSTSTPSGYKKELTANDAKAALTVNDGGTLRVGDFIWLGVKPGSTGILNIGGALDEKAEQAGHVETTQIHLGDTVEPGKTKAILNFNHLSKDFALSANITGQGEVFHNGSGTTLLSGNNTWTGPTQVNSGTLRAGSNSAFSPNADFTVAKGAELDLNGFDQTINSLSLLGTVNYGNTDYGQNESSVSKNVLTVNGDYDSDEGQLVLNTTKDADSSQSRVNRLHIKGNSAGTTYVLLNELGKLHDNLNGTQIVQVDGESHGQFLAGSRLIAGIHEYSVARGVAAEASEVETEAETMTAPDSNHWYLTNSVFIPVDPPGTDPDPGNEDPATDPEADPQTPSVTPPATPPASIKPDNGVVYRPEASAYLANRIAGNTLFNTRLYDRLGATEYIDPLTGEKSVTSMWLRNVGGHTRFRDSTGQMKTQANRYVVQLGGDLAQWSNGLKDRWHLGAMVGYANSHSNSRSAITQYQADGSVSGYSAGLYATWFANEEDKSGTYLDSWVLYNWFNNSVKGDQLATENYRSKGITASVETGIAFKTGESERVSYWVQPQMQLTWMGVSADDHREHNGTVVKDSGKGNLQSRVGVKAYLRGHSQLDDDKDRLFQPFIEANWLHNTDNAAVAMNGTTTEMKGAKNVGELRTGVEAKINDRLHAWGNIGQQVGSDGYSDTQAVLGIKVLF